MNPVFEPFLNQFGAEPCQDWPQGSFSKACATDGIPAQFGRLTPPERWSKFDRIKQDDEPAFCRRQLSAVALSSVALLGLLLVLKSLRNLCVVTPKNYGQ